MANEGNHRTDAQKLTSSDSGLLRNLLGLSQKTDPPLRLKLLSSEVLLEFVVKHDDGAS